MSELRLFLFGMPRFECDGEPVKITRRKVMALLAYLAVTGQSHSREAVATLLWPDSDATSAYAYLRNALWMVKQTPFSDWLETEQDTLELRQDHLWVDVARFEANLAACRAHPHPEQDVCADCVPLLKEAVALYRGDFMSGFTLEDSADFDEWQFFQAGALRRAVSGALEKLVLWYNQHGSLETALDYACVWQNLDPLHEEAQRHLMTLYAQLGQRATALHLYETLIRDLRAQGLAPSEETVTLYQRIRAGDIRPASEQATSSTAASGLPQGLPASVTESKPRNNLPTQVTACIGRKAELDELYRLLDDPDARLITLTGSGGIGKTRLALHIAEESLPAFPDGVFFVPLAAVETPELIVSTLADVLSLVLYQQSVAAPLTQLTQYLRDRRMLLVLDNLEQVLSGAPLIAELVQHTQIPKVLATSRERLNVQGEWVLELQGLRCPEQETAEEAETYGAVRLFLERARRINHDFAPDADELAAVVRICRLVQGMPLGLELAAAWTRLLSCREIADEIAISLDFLTLSLRDLPERHQSLRAVFTHSWGLLSQEERACYCALSVFRGGFTRAAAVEVAGASLPLLASLMDKSMLYRAASGRYEILEVLRQYAEEQLAATPEQSDAVRDRHCDYYLGLLQQLEPALKSPGKDATFGQVAALEVIQQDLDNIRVAWRRAIARGKTKALHAAAFSLGMFCDIRSRFREGLELFGEAIAALNRPEVEVTPELLGLLLGIQGEYMSRLSMPGCMDMLQQGVTLLDACAPGPELALVNVLSIYAVTKFDFKQRERRLRDSLAIYEARNDLWSMALVLAVEAETLDLTLRRDLESAKSHVLRALDLQRQIGDSWGTAISLFTLGGVHETQGEFLDARQCYQESLDVRRELKDMNGVGFCIHNLGRIFYRLGELDAARELQFQSLETMREVGASHGIPDALQALAEIAYSQGNLPEAQSFLIEACARRRAMSDTSWQHAFALLRLGDITRELADVEAAEGYYRESLALFEKNSHAEGCEWVRERAGL